MTIKYCKDCKYINEDYSSFYCTHPSIPLQLTGVKQVIIKCTTMRGTRFSGLYYQEIPVFCGPEASLFDPKPSRLQKFLQFFNPAPKA